VRSHSPAGAQQVLPNDSLWPHNHFLGVEQTNTRPGFVSPQKLHKPFEKAHLLHDANRENRFAKLRRAF
jgi:hypothetical protein